MKEAVVAYQLRCTIHFYLTPSVLSAPQQALNIPHARGLLCACYMCETQTPVTHSQKTSINGTYLIYKLCQLIILLVTELS